MIKWLATIGTTAALAASTCCVLPLTLGALGLSGSLISGFDGLAAYQTPLRLLALALLTTGFWMVYVRSPVARTGAACAPTPTAGWTKPVLWSGALVLTVVLSEPLWASWLF
jgi:mercuric ion transport protein